MPLQSRWNFTLVYPAVTALSQLDSLDYIRASDIFPSIPNGAAVFSAILDHMRERHVLGSERTIPEDLLVSGGEACYSDVTRWVVSQIRFEPYGIEIPGSPAVIRQWADESANSALAKMVELRLTLRPVCETTSGEAIPARAFDHALHVIIIPRPRDPELEARVFDPIHAFAKAAFDDAGAADGAITSHREALRSSEFQAFRADLIKEWINLFDGVDRTASTAGLEEKRAALLEQHKAAAQSEALHHPLLAARTPFSSKVKAYVKGRFDSALSVRNVAGMFTVLPSQAAIGSSLWFFSNTSLVPLSESDSAAFGALPAGAQATYALISPLPLHTHVSRLTPSGYQLLRATSPQKSPFYSESRTETRMVHVRPDDIPLYEAIDATLAPSALVSRPMVQALLNQFTTNASSTACESCHRMSGLERPIPDEPGNSWMMQDGLFVNFHLHGWDVKGRPMSSWRTMLEIDQDAVGVNYELRKNALVDQGIGEGEILRCLGDATAVKSVADCLEVEASLTCYEKCRLNDP